MAATKYEQDFYAWLHEQADMLRHGHFSALRERLQGSSSVFADGMHNSTAFLLLNCVVKVGGRR